MNACRDREQVIGQSGQSQWIFNVNFFPEALRLQQPLVAFVTGVLTRRPRVETLSAIGMGDQFIAHVSGHLQWTIPISEHGG